MGNISDRRMLEELSSRLNVVDEIMVASPESAAIDLTKAIAFVASGLVDSPSLERDADLIRGMAEALEWLQREAIGETADLLMTLRRKISNNLDN